MWPQVNCSFRLTFPELPLPSAISSFLAFWGFVNVDFFDLHWAAAFTSGIHFANTTILLLFSFLSFLLAVPLTYKLIARRCLRRRRQQQVAREGRRRG